MQALDCPVRIFYLLRKLIMPKQFEVTVSVLENKTFLVEADDAKHARSEIVRLGYYAESYTICKLVDKKVVQFDVLAVKGEEQQADWNRKALRAALHPIIDTQTIDGLKVVSPKKVFDGHFDGVSIPPSPIIEAYEEAFEAAALAQLRDSGVEVILMEEADDEGIACDNHIQAGLDKALEADND